MSDRSNVFLDTVRLEHPFHYTVATHSEEGVRDVAVDLPGTFNLLAGIKVDRDRWAEHEGRQYHVISGTHANEQVLVIWRDTEGLDPTSELLFLQKQCLSLLGRDLATFDQVWHNADSVIPNGRSLDAEFHRLMFEPEPGLE